uniref:Uncharacterized protein n=1 Tax=Rhizophora mucronata TaxID=61149 RepID=A0A2P2QF87_RHIMU
MIDFRLPRKAITGLLNKQLFMLPIPFSMDKEPETFQQGTNGTIDSTEAKVEQIM